MPATATADVDVESSPGRITVRLQGAWVLHELEHLQTRVDTVHPPAGDTVTIDGSALVGMDTAGVWLLRKLVVRLSADGRTATVEGLPVEVADLYALVDARLGTVDGIPRPEPQNMLERVGRSAWAWTLDLMALLAFVGETTIAFGRQLMSPRRIRWRTTAKVVEVSGVDALPIVGLLVFLIGVVVAYQGGRQLRLYGANIFVVEMVGLIMLRELAPLIAAIIVAGRTGSAYAAEIGTMRVTEEIDALKTLGIGPFDQLVLPKVVGLMISLPLLTVFADGVGVLGGMVMAAQVLDVTFTDFLQRMPQAVSVSDFVVGVVKAPVFAAIIAMVGCHQGFQVSGGADSVGRQTTVAVVQSIFLVIISDAAFSILFSWMGV